MVLLCVLNYMYVLNKSGLVCQWYKLLVIVKETNIVILLVYMGLYLLAAFLFWNWNLGGMAVHGDSTDVLHNFALLSVEARVCKYWTCFSVIVGKKYYQSHKTFGGYYWKNYHFYREKRASLGRYCLNLSFINSSSDSQFVLCLIRFHR